MDYDVTVDKIMNLLKKKGVCSSSQKSHKDCYISFAQFLEQTELEYSGEARDNWQVWMTDKFPRQRCMVWNQYINQLEEMAANLSVQTLLTCQVLKCSS